MPDRIAAEGTSRYSAIYTACDRVFGSNMHVSGAIPFLGIRRLRQDEIDILQTCSLFINAVTCSTLNFGQTTLKDIEQGNTTRRYNAGSTRDAGV